MSSEIDELRKKYGDRKASEWFMRAEDKRYWKQAQREMQSHRSEVEELVKNKSRKMTALIAVSTVITLYMAITLSNRFHSH